MAGLVDRMVRAAKLDPALYEEVEADTGATGQAMTVVVLSALAAGVGAWGGEGGTGAVVGTIILALAGWFIWAGLTYILGTKLFPGPRTTSNLGELLRTIGFASAPGMLRVLGGLQVVGRFIGLGGAAGARLRQYGARRARLCDRMDRVRRHTRRLGRGATRRRRDARRVELTTPSH